jgi:heme a synthase
MLWTSCANSFASAKLSSRLASTVRVLKTANARLKALSVRNVHTSQASPALSSRILNSLPQRPAGLWTQKRPLSGAVNASKIRTFDPRFFSSNAASAHAELPVLSPPPVAMWLLTSSALVFAVIVVGGVTRLTESGLSITEWRPVSGILPPLSQAEWETEFDKYKRTPEFKM